MKKWIKAVLLIAALAVIMKAIWYLNPEAQDERGDQPQITLYLSESDKRVSLTMEEYITGTVAAEMPASFSSEALKAQAVCARTYALNRLVNDIKYEKDADLSDDITCCQAYVTPGEFSKRHPSNTDEYLKKMQQAVRDTRGVIMLYQGAPLDALYCSTCGGKTEEGGNQRPYLKGVSCSFCSLSPRYLNSQSFSGIQLRRVLGLQGDIRIKVLGTSSSGRIKQVRINNRTLSGEQLRSALGLYSTWCSFKNDGDGLIITSRGYGHGIGLCQFGANGMAQAGYDYRQILHYYYQGFELYRLPY